MGRYGLKPLNADPDRKSPSFGVCDIESAKGWINFLVIGLAWEKDGTRHYQYFISMAEFVDFIFSDDFPNATIFAHFGGRYDFSFILKEFYFRSDQYHIGTLIPRGSGLLCFEVSTFTREDFIPKDKTEKDVIGKTDDGKFLIKNRTISFRDSSAMLPFGLASLSQNFGVDHKKKEIDYDSITKVTPELLEYLEYDCWALYECLTEYFKWEIIRDAGPAMTVASQSLRVFRTFMTKEIPSLSPRVDAFVRSSYFGGRTEIFKPFFEQHQDNEMLKSYDVNSLYPFIMREMEFPGGLKYETQIYKENELGFYDVEVEVPDMYVPPLGTRSAALEGRLIFPTGRFRGVWSTHELNYAMSIGVKLHKVYSGMVFNNLGKIFEHYIERLYAIRKASAKNSVDNVLCKLLMNSTYGRFGLNLMREQLVLDQGQLGVTPFMEIPLDENGKRMIRLAKQELTLDTSFSNVAIAAWVTSGARVHMHKLIQLAPEHMYYMDTDSLKTTHQYHRNDDDLGQLKLEYKSKRACFLLPKTYIEDTTSPIFKVFDSKGKAHRSSKKLVMKGFDKKKIAMFTPEDFSSCLEGDMKRLQAMNPEKFAPLKTAIKKNEFLMLLKETPRQIRTRYNKRKVIKRAWSQVYDTEPLNLDGDTVTNMDMKILKKWDGSRQEMMDKIAHEVHAKWSSDEQARNKT